MLWIPQMFQYVRTKKAFELSAGLLMWNQFAGEHTLGVPSTCARNLTGINVITSLLKLPAAISPRAAEVENAHPRGYPGRLNKVDVSGIVLLGTGKPRFF